MGWLADAGPPDAAQDEVAFALAAMARRHLVDEARAPRLLRAPLLARAGLSDAALMLIAAMHSQGAPSLDDPTSTNTRTRMGGAVVGDAANAAHCRTTPGLQACL